MCGAGDAHVMDKWLRESETPPELPEKMRENGITHLFINFAEWSRLKKPYGYLDLSDEKMKLFRDTAMSGGEIYRKPPVIIIELFGN